jgi:Protein of unknown function (DUF2510)
MAPAGWYEDPSHAGLVRWWDGNKWTDNVATGPHAQTNADTKRQRIKRHIFLTHARSMVLFGLTVVAAFIAFALYPGSAPAHATSNITEIDFYLTVPTSPADTTNNPRVNVDMKPDGHKGTKLQFWSEKGSPDIDTITVAVATSTWGPRPTDCGTNQPSGVNCTVTKDKSAKLLNDPNPSSDDWVDIPAAAGAGGWGAIVNDEYVSFMVPTVDVLQDQKHGSAQDANAIAFIGYHAKLHDDYTWSNGAEPQDLTGGDPKFPIQTEASWSPVAENGTAQAELDQVQFHTFVAGAAVGVGAAAFAAAIAELIGTSADESRIRRRLAANTPAT